MKSGRTLPVHNPFSCVVQPLEYGAIQNTLPFPNRAEESIFAWHLCRTCAGGLYVSTHSLKKTRNYRVNYSAQCYEFLRNIEKHLNLINVVVSHV